MGIIGRSVQYDHQIDLTINIGQSYILDKSSNWPLRFCPFSSKPKSALQLYLHLQIGWCVSQIRHKKVLQNSEHCMQDAPMNTGTTIFKIHKIQHLSQFVKNHWNIQISWAKPLHYYSIWLKKQMYTEMNNIPAWHWLLWIKMLKLTPPSNANSC